jgi:hypothetical protein
MYVITTPSEMLRCALHDQYCLCFFLNVFPNPKQLDRALREVFFALKPTVSQSIRVQAAYETSAPASFYCAIG